VRDAYSERFCLVKKPTNPLQSFTVPAGKRAVVRSLVYYGYLATGPAIFLRIADIYVWAALPPGATFGLSTEMYQVAYANERITLEVTSSAGEMGACCSGYLLTDTVIRAGQLPAPPAGELPPHPPIEPPYDREAAA